MSQFKWKSENYKSLTIDTHPNYFSCFTRRIRLNLDGETIIEGPLFLNTYLSKPFLQV